MENNNFWALFFGAFVAETVKNVAKGSANILQEKVSSYLQPEFIALNLNEEDTPEQIQQKLEAKPDVKQIIRQKLEAKPDLLEQLTELLKKQEGRVINTKTYIENAGDITINQ